MENLCYLVKSKGNFCEKVRINPVIVVAFNCTEHHLSTHGIFRILTTERGYCSVLLRKVCIGISQRSNSNVLNSIYVHYLNQLLAKCFQHVECFSESTNDAKPKK